MVVASLTIDAWRTTLAIPTDDQKQRHNIIGCDDDGDWHNNHINYFRNAADRQLTEAGYQRTGDWTYNPGRDTHTAPIRKAT